jgi:hypothetical protein
LLGVELALGSVRSCAQAVSAIAPAGVRRGTGSRRPDVHGGTGGAPEILGALVS